MNKILSLLFLFSITFVFCQIENSNQLFSKKDIIDNLEIKNNLLSTINTQLNDTISVLQNKNELFSERINNIENENNLNIEKLKCQKIGEQYWMKQNLSVLKLTNGQDLIHAKTNKEWDDCFTNNIPAYCYHQIDSLNQNGVLYNVHALNSDFLAPKGYKIPTKQEVEEMIFSFNSLKDSASLLLKSDDKNTWKKKGVDLFDMNIKPFGFRLSDGVDWYSGDKVFFYCNSDLNKNELLDVFVFSEFSNKIYFLNRSKLTDNINYGLYVRCIIDK
jgi:uncharacterized protein (TIGR02145 family)